MKVWKGILRTRLNSIVKIGSHQYGFVAGNSTTDAIFIVRQLQEKYCRKKKLLCHIFVNLEKSFDKIPRKAIEWALRKQLVPEKLVRLVMTLYSESTSKVRFAAVLSTPFPC